MNTAELLDRYFAFRQPTIRWARQHWCGWAMKTLEHRQLAPLAVFFPAPRPARAGVMRVLEEDAAYLDTPTFAELQAAAGAPMWIDEGHERLRRVGDHVFNVSLLARGLAVVAACPPAKGTVVLDVAKKSGIMRVHTRRWLVLLAMTTYTKAEALTFADGRRVA